MSEQTAEIPVPEWNPFLVPTPETRTLTSSPNGASVTFARWTGRERLAYEDALTERLMTKVESDDSDTVKIGTMRLLSVALTVRGSSGFPMMSDGRAFLEGTPRQRENDLLLLGDSDVYDEIAKYALEIQPLPRVDGGDNADGEEGEEGEDPFPTPSTPTTASVEPPTSA